jgi:hypothetical protein
MDVCVATGQQTARIVITQTGCRLPVWSRLNTRKTRTTQFR